MPRTLALVQAAKGAGLTIAQTHALLHGFPEEVGASERWRSLASRKLEEVDEMARLRRTRVLLAEDLRCDCSNLEECADLMADR